MTTETSDATARETTNAQINDVAKESIKRRLVKAINDEKLYTSDAGVLLGISAPYVSMMKNPETWRSCTNVAWTAAQKWANSGLSLIKYGEINGRKAVKKEEKLPAKEQNRPTGSPEAMANAYEISQGKEPTIHNQAKEKKEMPVLLLVFGSGKESVELTDVDIEEAINEIKKPSGIYYYGDHGNVTVYETKKVYSIEVKMVETRF